MYALPVLGGWVADRLLGHRRALTVGGTLMLGGYVVLTIAVLVARMSPAAAPLGFWRTPDHLSCEVGRQCGPVTAGFWVAICALVVGCALIKSTLVVALGDAFSQTDARRERAYAYYYAGINLGGLVAGLIAGSVAAAYGWAPAFSVSAFAMGVALAAYVTVGRRHLKPREASRAQVTGADALPKSLEAGSGVRLFILAVFALLLLVYSIGSFQLWGTMSLFLERDVNRHAGAFEIPTQWYTSIESAGLIIAAPTFAALWAWLARRDRDPDILIKYVLALSLGAAGLLLFAAAAGPHSAGTKPGWVLPGLGIAIQAMGEVAAWTVSYGLVYRLAPRRMVAAIMGAFYAMTLGLGAYLAGWLGTFAEPWGQGRFFLALGAATAAAAVAAGPLRSPLRAPAASRRGTLYPPPAQPPTRPPRRRLSSVALV